MSRSAKPKRPPPVLPKLRRSTATEAPRKLVLVCCEGETERVYVEQYSAEHRGESVVNVQVIGSCGVPSSVVRAVMAFRSRRREELRAERTPTSIRVEAWAVVDRDEHPSQILGQARDLARSNDVGMILSNPCFEIWPLLHLHDQRAWIHRHACQAALHARMPGYHHDKHCYVDMDALRGLEGVAEQRAKLLERHHLESGAADNNPSTDLWRLIAALRG